MTSGSETFLVDMIVIPVRDNTSGLRKPFSYFSRTRILSSSSKNKNTSHCTRTRLSRTHKTSLSFCGALVAVCGSSDCTRVIPSDCAIVCTHLAIAFIAHASVVMQNPISPADVGSSIESFNSRIVLYKAQRVAASPGTRYIYRQKREHPKQIVPMRPKDYLNRKLTTKYRSPRLICFPHRSIGGLQQPRSSIGVLQLAAALMGRRKRDRQTSRRRLSSIKFAFPSVPPANPDTYCR